MGVEDGVILRQASVLTLRIESHVALVFGLPIGLAAPSEVLDAEAGAKPALARLDKPGRPRAAVLILLEPHLSWSLILDACEPWDVSSVDGPEIIIAVAVLVPHVEEAERHGVGCVEFEEQREDLQASFLDQLIGVEDEKPRRPKLEGGVPCEEA